MKMKSPVAPFFAILLLSNLSDANPFDTDSRDDGRGNGQDGGGSLRATHRKRNHESWVGSTINKITRIIGGSESTPNEHKFVASLADEVGPFCGGSLVAPDVVLTAAHCQGAPFDVILGCHDIGNGARSCGQRIGITRQLPHPRYRESRTDMDMMLVFLEEPATINSNVQVVPLNSDPSYPRPGDTMTVMGWGDTHASDSVTRPSDVLNEVDVSVISNDECDASSGRVDGQWDSYRGQITDNMLCAEARNQDACQGDSGGPLVDAATGVQTGVVSWGISCAHSDFPGVYARVSRAYDWIEEEVCARSRYAEEGTGFDCDGNGNGNNGGGNGGGSGVSSLSVPSPSPPNSNPPPSKPNKPSSPSKPSFQEASSPSNGSGGSSNCSRHDNKWDCKADDKCRWRKGQCLKKKVPKWAQ